MVTISSFSCESQLSSREAISKANRSFCSGVSFSTHFFLSNFDNGAAASASGGATAADVKMDAVVAVVDVLVSSEASPRTVAGEEGIVEEAVD